MSMITSSNSETLYPGEVDASQSYKLVRLVRTLKMQWTDNPKAEINIYGYINSEVRYDDAKQRDERASMRQRINSIGDVLKQIGVPDAQIYVAGVVFSSNRFGQIDLSIRDGKSTFILPPYPPPVPPSDPKKPSAPREQWLDSDSEIGVDPKERKIEVEVSVKSPGVPLGKKIIQPALTCVFREDGSLKEIGAEINLKEIAKKIGGLSDVEIVVKTIGSIEFSKTDAERYRAELQAKFKYELSANIPIPGTQPYNPEKKENMPEKQTKIPIRLSIDIDPKGELGVSALITVIEF